MAGRASNKQIKISVDDTAYGPSWDGNLEAASKNAIYDKIETLGNGQVTSIIAGPGITVDQATGDVTISATGLGDMLKATYDPTNVDGNAFDMDNMVEGVTNLILTSSERTILSNTSGVNTGDQDLSSLALKINVLELDNTTPFTPDDDYEPATKKYVDDKDVGVSSIIAGQGISIDQSTGAVTITNSLTISDEIYGASWNGNTDGASKNSIYDEIESVKTTITPIDDTPFANSWNGNFDGATKNSIYDKIISIESTIPTVDNSVYGSGWDGNLDGASKNAIYDEIESVKLTIIPIDNTAYGPSWDGNTDGATKNAIYDKIEAIVLGGVTSILAGQGISVDQATGDVTITSDVVIDGTAYGPSWDGNSEGATKNAIYDKIESLVNSGVQSIIAGDGISIDQSTGDVTITATVNIDDTPYGISWNGNLDGASKNAIYDEIEIVKGLIPNISPDAYGPSWDGDLDGASKDSIYDEIESVKVLIPTINNEIYGATWNGSLEAATRGVLYDKIETLLDSSSLEDTLADGNLASSPDTNTTLILDVSNTSSLSFRRYDDGNDIDYGIIVDNSYSRLFFRTGDSLGGFKAANGEAQLVTENISDGASKTILNIPTAATDGFEFQVNLPRPTLVADTEITMPITINGNYADANGNIVVSATAGVNSIIAGPGITIDQPSGDVTISSAAGTIPTLQEVLDQGNTGDQSAGSGTFTIELTSSVGYTTRYGSLGNVVIQNNPGVTGSSTIWGFQDGNGATYNQWAFTSSGDLGIIGWGGNTGFSFDFGIVPDGGLSSKNYGAGNQTGTLTYLLGTTAGGQFIEVDPNSIGGATPTLQAVFDESLSGNDVIATINTDKQFKFSSLNGLTVSDNDSSFSASSVLSWSSISSVYRDNNSAGQHRFTVAGGEIDMYASDFSFSQKRGIRTAGGQNLYALLEKRDDPTIGTRFWFGQYTSFPDNFMLNYFVPRPTITGIVNRTLPMQFTDSVTTIEADTDGVVDLSTLNLGGGGSGWSLTGNSGLTNGVDNILGTTDNINVLLTQNNKTNIELNNSGAIFRMDVGSTHLVQFRALSSQNDNIRPFDIRTDFSGASYYTDLEFKWNNGGTYLIEGKLSIQEDSHINSRSGNFGIGTTVGDVLGEKLTVSGYTEATGYKVPSGTDNDILLGDGTTTSLSGLVTTVTAASPAVNRETVLADASSAAFTVTLPAPTSGYMIRIKKIDSSANIVTIASLSGNIDGSATLDLTTQYEGKTFIGDGSNWHVF